MEQHVADPAAAHDAQQRGSTDVDVELDCREMRCPLPIIRLANNIHKEFAAPNLTSDPKTGLTGKLSEDQFIARFRHGRVYPAPLMPWENLSRMSESDQRSIYRYLRSLPPIEREVGPSYRDRGWKPSEG